MSATHLETSAPGRMPQLTSESENVAFFGGEGEIAAEQLHEGTADAIAVHHGDGRLVVIVQTLPAPAVSGGRRLLALGRVLFQFAEEALEVLAGAEVAALAADDHHLDVVIDFEPRQRVIHVVM